jgi:PAS domain S-box-containing protein
MTGRFFSEICRDLALSARRQGEHVLSHLLDMAALESARTGARDDDYRGPQELLVGAWDWDVENDLVYADPRFARMFGISANDAAHGTPISAWIVAVHPDDREYLRGEIQRALAGGLFAAEYRVVTEGKVRWLFARGRCTRDKNGRPIRFPGAIIEITHEKSDVQVSLAPKTQD